MRIALPCSTPSGRSIAVFGGVRALGRKLSFVAGYRRDSGERLRVGYGLL